MSNRNPDGTFKKGMSGNPGGRVKGITALVKELSHDYQDYIILLDQFARDETLPVKERRECIKELFDRSVGRPKQYVEQKVEYAQLEELLESLEDEDVVATEDTTTSD